MERHSLNMLKEVEVREKYQLKISNMFATVGNLHDTRTQTGLWETLDRISNFQLKRV
jgi:hypothetical protein